MPSEPSPSEQLRPNPATAQTSSVTEDDGATRTYHPPTGRVLPDENPFTQRMHALAQEYLDKGKVIRLHSSSTQYLGIVSGRDDVRRTELKYIDGQLTVLCNCPEFPVAHACDHLVAVMLQARTQRWDPLVGSSYGDWLDEPIADAASDWRTELARVEARAKTQRETRFSQFALEQLQLIFILEKGSDYSGELYNVELRARTRDANGGWNESKPLSAEDELPGLDAVDARLVQLFQLEDHEAGFRRVRGAMQRRGSLLSLDATNISTMLPLFAESERLYLEEETDESLLLWRGRNPWELQLELVEAYDPNAAGALPPEQMTYDLVGRLLCDDIVRDLDDIELLSADLFRLGHEIHRLQDPTHSNWITHLHRGDFMGISSDDRQEFLRALLEFDPPPPLLLNDPEWERVVGEPRGHVVVEREVVQGRGRNSSRLRCHVSFDYGDDFRVDATATSSLVGWRSQRVAVVRNIPAETELLKELFSAGARRAKGSSHLDTITVTKSALLPMVLELGRRQWIVEAEGKLYRTGGSFNLKVSSGIDWFQVDGGVRFGSQELTLPKILSRVQKGTNLVRLGDGSIGVLPDDWMRQVGLLKGLGTKEEDAYRFGRNQGWVLNALLAAEAHVTTDTAFDDYREKLQSFAGIAALHEPETFGGTLRPYQREALGWFEFLRDFGLGGCLADDMGLGKTVELLAYLELLRVEGKTEGPHLVVAPRSVLGNWLREGEKFAPQMTFIDASGVDRQQRLRALQSGEVALITYGTLRRDIFLLKDIPFDTITLDESQAIKNSQSQTAQSSRLLQARQRIALSGTPIENNLGELWSLFEYLNPGMLGSSKTFQKFAVGGDDPDSGMEMLARAIRPFVLRRTKEQVLRDLPEKVEQTLYCEMGKTQSTLYQELREYYQTLLLQSKGDAELEAAADSGTGGANTMQVLEALLRLRQLACHPGLLDADRRAEESVKLEVLTEHLEEVQETGHKALVFSQFTKFLSIVQQRLEEKNITYEYLDGKTRNRDERVDRFQTDPDCRVFLISLKAGGVGLNLTAADYVFILDPWWNPATEAQAIDRAHRIGQDKPVFAYRLVTRNTVEERILELQAEKKHLTESIIRADRGLLKTITREDLELLLA